VDQDRRDYESRHVHPHYLEGIIVALAERHRTNLTLVRCAKARI
jgi:hypothetical protein